MSRRQKDIPVFRTGLETGPAAEFRACDHAGCTGEGRFRAPKRADSDDFYWFCLDHIRSYNGNWNYFAGWDGEAIDRFRRDAVTGHRPTWRLGQRGVDWQRLRLEDPFDTLRVGGADSADMALAPLPENQRRALAILNLDRTASLQEIKMRYKQLVKRFHPDVNGGDKKAEESFKTITEAYNQLMACGYG